MIELLLVGAVLMAANFGRGIVSLAVVDAPKGVDIALVRDFVTACEFRS